MFREMMVRGLRTGRGVGERMRGNENDWDNDDGGDGDNDGEGWGGSASNVRIKGVAWSSTRLGNKLGERKGETTVGVRDRDCCWDLAE